MTIYKRLGDYIREVNVRNKDLKVTKPKGLSPVSNTAGD